MNPSTLAALTSSASVASTAKAYGGKRGKTVEELGYDPDAWSTPQWLFDELNAEFDFSVDLFASVDNHKCETFLTVADDAFVFDWAGGITRGPGFGNPPYSRVREAIEKALHEFSNGFPSVLLVKADTSTKWFRENWKKVPEVRFLPRIQFDPPPGYTGKVGSPNMGHALLVFR